MPAVVLHIDGNTHEVEYHGPDQALHGLTTDGGTWRLEPVCFDEHCRLLETHTRFTAERLVLDSKAYSVAILQHNGLDPDAHRSLRPVVLWWAAGAPLEPVSPPPADIAIRPWSHGERLYARQAATSQNTDGQSFLHPVAYLRRMLFTCCDSWQSHPAAFDALPAGIFQPLLAAVLRCNADDDTAATFDTMDEVERSRILQLCRLLGWTPRQVLDCPAREVDVLLRYLLQQQPTPVATPRSAMPTGHSVWAAASDSVVIAIDEDEP